MADDHRFARSIERAQRIENVLIEHHSRSAELVDEHCALTGQSPDDLTGPNGYKLAVYKAAEVALYNVIHEIWNITKDEASIAQRPNGGLSQEEISLLTAIGTNAASNSPGILSILAALDGLVAKGLVEEITLPDLQRGERMKMTEAGKIVFSLLSA